MGGEPEAPVAQGAGETSTNAPPNPSDPRQEDQGLSQDAIPIDKYAEPLP